MVGHQKKATTNQPEAAMLTSYNKQLKTAKIPRRRIVVKTVVSNKVKFNIKGKTTENEVLLSVWSASMSSVFPVC